MPRLPRNPPSDTKPAAKRGGRRYGPPGPLNIVRFARSLWPGKAQEQTRCDALIEATLTTINGLADAELRRACLRRLLDLTYEGLKEP